MEIGRGENDDELNKRMNSQAPNKCSTLIYTVSYIFLINFIVVCLHENTHSIEMYKQVLVKDNVITRSCTECHCKYLSVLIFIKIIEEFF